MHAICVHTHTNIKNMFCFTSMQIKNHLDKLIWCIIQTESKYSSFQFGLHLIYKHSLIARTNLKIEKLTINRQFIESIDYGVVHWPWTACNCNCLPYSLLHTVFNMLVLLQRSSRNEFHDLQRMWQSKF